MDVVQVLKVDLGKSHQVAERLQRIIEELGKKGINIVELKYEHGTRFAQFYNVQKELAEIIKETAKLICQNDAEEE